MTGEEAGTKNKVVSQNEEANLLEFHFSGGLEYEPLTVRAATRDEAEAEWERLRKPLS